MRIGIYYVIGSADSAENEAQRRMGSLAAMVAKRTMPDVEVCHLTDNRTDAFDGVDRVIRMERDCPMAIFRMRHHQASGEWLFIDSDVLVTQDVSDLFYEAFDIAIANRVPGDGSEHAGFAEMPHNMGVVFSRCPAFWREAEKELLKYSLQQQEWMGDQLAVCRLIRSNTFNVKKLPGETYNFPPRTSAMPTAAIVHYKGKRKPWMVEHANQILQQTMEAA